MLSIYFNGQKVANKATVVKSAIKNSKMKEGVYEFRNSNDKIAFKVKYQLVINKKTKKGHLKVIGKQFM